MGKDRQMIITMTDLFGLNLNGEKSSGAGFPSLESATNCAVLSNGLGLIVPCIDRTLIDSKGKIIGGVEFPIKTSAFTGVEVIEMIMVYQEIIGKIFQLKWRVYN